MYPFKLAVFVVLSLLFAGSAHAIPEKDTGNLGEIRHSLLELADFQRIYGEGWVIMDGQNIENSDLYRDRLWPHTHLPDGRGRFLRSQSYQTGCNPEPKMTGELQEDAFKRHCHAALHPHVQDPAASRRMVSGIGGIGSRVVDGDPNFTSLSGDLETRPKCVIVNTYIKINRTRVNQEKMEILSHISKIPLRIFESDVFQQLNQRINQRMEEVQPRLIELGGLSLTNRSLE